MRRGQRFSGSGTGDSGALKDPLGSPLISLERMIIRRRTFAFEVIEDLELLVSYQGPTSPSDGEWATYLQVLERLHRVPSRYRYLTISEGGHPSGAQQARVKAVTHGRTPPVAVVSTSVAIRFVVSLLALFNHRVKCFGPEQTDRAFEHIGIGHTDQARVRACIAKLKGQIANQTEAA